MTCVKAPLTGPQLDAEGQESLDAGRPVSAVRMTRKAVRSRSAWGRPIRALSTALAAVLVMLAGLALVPGPVQAAVADSCNASVELVPGPAHTQAQPDVLPDVPWATQSTLDLLTGVAPVVRAVELPEWVRNSVQIELWSHAQEPARQLVDVPADSMLRVMSLAENGRALVYFADPAPNGEKIAGWVDGTALQPADPVTRVSVSSRGGARTTPKTEKPHEFIASVLAAAQESERQYGVPTSVIIAQAIVESEWGRSGLAKMAQNYFGIKANEPGPAGVINMDTMEVQNGASVSLSAGFKAYHNAYESFLDHGKFLSENSRYRKAFETTDADEFVRRVHAAGYASDPEYTSKLVATMEHYDLYRYNLKQ